ncbi:MAG: winged helix-turn-helix transcriptional regulator [Patescibacteria group bacterium]
MVLLYLIIGAVVGYALGFMRGVKTCAESEVNRERNEKIMELFEGKDSINNDDIQKLLGVSDASATRYLDELEKEGKVKQVGKTGKHVYYEKA